MLDESENKGQNPEANRTASEGSKERALVFRASVQLFPSTFPFSPMLAMYRRDGLTTYTAQRSLISPDDDKKESGQKKV